ncbi:hypothetical protein A2272_05090 [Candidatus Peregrinibacteria bacterium RIFOXYA12_FULL_33_12]|nr:MAG: hypothetical protein A2272_05090 [Candidatus Peregrinibacteria bacterium RIFOXYA12_FULL_33_12]
MPELAQNAPELVDSSQGCRESNKTPKQILNEVRGLKSDLQGEINRAQRLKDVDREVLKQQLDAITSKVDVIPKAGCEHLALLEEAYRELQNFEKKFTTNSQTLAKELELTRTEDPEQEVKGPKTLKEILKNLSTNSQKLLELALGNLKKLSNEEIQVLVQQLADPETLKRLDRTIASYGKAQQTLVQFSSQFPKAERYIDLVRDEMSQMWNDKILTGMREMLSGNGNLTWGTNIDRYENFSDLNYLTVMLAMNIIKGDNIVIPPDQFNSIADLVNHSNYKSAAGVLTDIISQHDREILSPETVMTKNANGHKRNGSPAENSLETMLAELEPILKQYPDVYEYVERAFKDQGLFKGLAFKLCSDIPDYAMARRAIRLITTPENEDMLQASLLKYAQYKIGELAPNYMIDINGREQKFSEVLAVALKDNRFDLDVMNAVSQFRKFYGDQKTEELIRYLPDNAQASLGDFKQGSDLIAQAE